MTSTASASIPPEIGTLIVVVLKAKNLPNKRHIGKQDPYCTIRHGGETKRTKALKRGGQHPEWDEELRFTIYEDLDDEWAKLTDTTTDSQPPPPPPKEKKKRRKIKGGLNMLVTCFADDPREPVYIGETTVDLTEALTKGETDEWFTLTNKEKYCGEVYLELTFWSNEKPPAKKPKRPSSSFNPQYGGPGSFTPSSSDGSPLPPNGGSPARMDSSSISSLKTSSSIASVNLYQPPYERQSRHSDVDQLASRINDLSVDSNRRESLPPPNNTGLSEFGYTETNGTYNNTLSSSGSISSIHSIHSSPPSLNPHHRNTFSALPEGLTPGVGTHSPGTSINPLRIPSASYRSPHSPHPSGYDPVSVVDNYPSSSSGFSYAAAFPEPEIPTPTYTPVSYPSYDIAPPPPPVAPSGFVLPQPSPLNADYSPSSYPYQPSLSHANHQPPPTSQTPQPPRTPFQPVQTPFPPPPPPMNSYPIQAHATSFRPSEGYGVEGYPSETAISPPRDSPTRTTPSPNPPVSAFQQLQGVAPQGSRPLPSPQVKSEQTGTSGFSAVSSSGVPFSAPGPPPPLPPPPPPPPPPTRHRPSLPPTPSLTPSVSYPPSTPLSYSSSTFNTPPPPPPPSQYYNHSSPSPHHHVQSSFNSHLYNAPEHPSKGGSPHQMYPYATPPPPSRTPALPYQSPSQWHTPPHTSGYANTPLHAAQSYSSPPPPVMPTPNIYSNAPAAPPYGYPPSNQYGW